MTEHIWVPAQAGDVYEQMTVMMHSHYVSQMVRAAADLSLADHLGRERLTAAEVAEREGSAPNTTFRLMRACVELGLLTADADGRFGSTPLLQTLASLSWNRSRTSQRCRGGRHRLRRSMGATGICWATPAPRRCDRASNTNATTGARSPRRRHSLLQLIIGCDSTIVGVGIRRSGCSHPSTTNRR